MISPNQLPEELMAPFKTLTGAAGSVPLANAVQPAPAAPVAAPVPAPGQQALANPMDIPTPMSFSAKIGKAADELGIPTDKPGGWARSLVGAAQKALAGLGDVSTKPGGGALAGVVETLQNRNARITEMAAQQQARQDKLDQQKIENQRADKADKLAQQRADDLHAYTTAETVSTQRTAAKLDEEAMDKHVAAGKAASDMYKKNHTMVASGVTEDEMLPEFKTGGKYDPATSRGYQVGTAEVIKNGKKVVEPTYDVFQRSGREVEISPEAAAVLKQYGGSNVNLPAGTSMDGDLFDSVMTGAMAAQTSVQLLNTQNRELKIAEMKGDNILRHAADLTAVNPYLGAHSADPITALSELSQEKGKDGNQTPAAGAAARLLQDYTPEQMETHRKNIEDERINQDKATQKKAQDSSFAGDDSTIGRPVATDGDLKGANVAYLNSLEPQDRNIITMIGTKRVPLERYDYLLARKPEMMSALANAFPQFTGYDAKKHTDVTKLFTSGKVAAAINSYGTMSQHLKTLYDNSGPAGFIPGTKEYTTRKNITERLVDEIASFDAAGGVPSIPLLGNARDALKSGTLGPWNAKLAAQNTAEALSQKYGSYENEWSNAQPSGWNDPMPGINQAAKDAVQYVLHDGQAPQQEQPVQPQGQPQAQQVPQGNVVVTLPDGRHGHVSQAALAKFLQDHPGAQQVNPK